MNKQFSIYLDLFRFMAATLVFMSHLPRFADGWFWQFGGMGHEAVILFFVLSGFVISFVVFQKGEDLPPYTINRASRIYSIAIPALILSLALYHLTSYINPEPLESVTPFIRDTNGTLLAGLLFLNQSWFPTTIFSNLPYWSLGYEVWYYILFAVVVFTKGFVRVSLGTLTLLIMGPSIIAYLPIWLAGVACFVFTKRVNTPYWLCLMMLPVSIVGFSLSALKTVRVELTGHLSDFLGKDIYSWLLNPTEYLLSDYLLTFFTVMHIVSMFGIVQKHQLFNAPLERIIRSVSKHTFGFYLFHMPILYFFAALIPFERYPVLSVVSLWIFTPGLSLLLSIWAEKHRGQYTVFFTGVLGAINNKRGSNAPA
jgi:peptidoglycan/LPS O-acetylase OafA/YrhL